MTGNFFSRWIYWAPFVLQLLFLCVSVFCWWQALQLRYPLLSDGSTIHTHIHRKKTQQHTTTVYLSEKTCSTLNLRSVPPFNRNIRAVFHSHQSFVWEWVDAMCVLAIQSHWHTNETKRNECRKRKVLFADMCAFFMCSLVEFSGNLAFYDCWLCECMREGVHTCNSRKKQQQLSNWKSMRTIFGMQCFILCHLSMLYHFIIIVYIDERRTSTKLTAHNLHGIPLLDHDQIKIGFHCK